MTNPVQEIKKHFLNTQIQFGRQREEFSPEIPCGNGQNLQLKRHPSLLFWRDYLLFSARKWMSPQDLVCVAVQRREGEGRKRSYWFSIELQSRINLEEHKTLNLFTT